MTVMRAGDGGGAVPSGGEGGAVSSGGGGHGHEAGQGIVEYGLILGGSALLAIVLLVFFGGTMSAFLKLVGDAIDAAS